MKILHTHHGGLDTAWWTAPPFKLNFIAISRFMQDTYQRQGFDAGYVYNGVDLDKYGFREAKGGRLLFVGRVDKFKQPHVAIEVARRANIPIDVVGGTFVQDTVYLREIEEMCDG